MIRQGLEALYRVESEPVSILLRMLTYERWVLQVVLSVKDDFQTQEFANDG